MLELLGRLPAEPLPLARYREDFQEHFWNAKCSWKLERQPSFVEPDTPSWVALANGDWAESVRLAEQLRPSRAEFQAKLNERGIVQRRVRFVTDPLTTYLRWELRVLTIWAELGEEITVLPVERVGALERVGPLPEALVLDGDGDHLPVMYEILYEGGALAGARKFRNRSLIARCRAQIADLWRAGEPLRSFYARDVAHLPPPAIQPVA